MSNQQKRILITGGTGGMGRLCAQVAAAEGYRLVLADLASAKPEQFAKELSEAGSPAEGHPLDVTDPESTSQLAQAVAESGGVDAIIHTVGISPHMADWLKIIDVDLVGTARLLEALRPSLKTGGGAVCISSMSAYLCPPNEAVEGALADPLSPGFMDQLKNLPDNPLEDTGLAYSYAKKALQDFVQNRAKEWGADGKRLVSLSPGLIDTEQGRLEGVERMQSRVALGRLGKPEDIANTALFLVSEKAAYITGCDILVDGGFIASMRQNPVTDW